MKNFAPKIEYFKGLVVRFWLVILVTSVAGGCLGGIVSRICYEPEYQMTQAFIIELKENPSANDASTNETQLSKTIPSLLSSNTFMDLMAPIIKDAGASGKFKVTSLETSNIFYLTCVARSNNDAQIIINEISEHYADLADYVVGESQMKFLAPPTYSKFPLNTPHYTKSALLGLFAGAFVVLLLFALLSLFSNAITDASDLENEINTKCLAVVRRVYEKKRSDKKGRATPFAVDEGADFDFKKSVSTLSANVHQSCIEKGFKSILVTSTISGEGKSTTALNLALDLADKGQRVVIVDYDLRNPSIAKYLEIDEIKTPLSQSAKTKDYISSVVKTDFANLYFCGNIDGNDTGFDEVKDNEIKALIEVLKESFDYVIIDTAPVGFLGDAISISRVADCFLYVVAYNSVFKPNIIRCMSLLNETNRNMLGFVLNNK